MTKATLEMQLEALEQQISRSIASLDSHLAMIERERADSINPGTSDATLALLKIALESQEATRDKLRGTLATLAQSQASAGMGNGASPPRAVSRDISRQE